MQDGAHSDEGIDFSGKEGSPGILPGGGDIDLGVQGIVWVRKCTKTSGKDLPGRWDSRSKGMGHGGYNWQLQEEGGREGAAAGEVGRRLIIGLVCLSCIDFTLRVKGFKRGSGMIVIPIPCCWCDGWIRVG